MNIYIYTLKKYNFVQLHIVYIEHYYEHFVHVWDAIAALDDADHRSRNVSDGSDNKKCKLHL